MMLCTLDGSRGFNYDSIGLFKSGNFKLVRHRLQVYLFLFIEQVNFLVATFSTSSCRNEQEEGKIKSGFRDRKRR